MSGTTYDTEISSMRENILQNILQLRRQLDSTALCRDVGIQSKPIRLIAPFSRILAYNKLFGHTHLVPTAKTESAKTEYVVDWILEVKNHEPPDSEGKTA